MPRYLPRLPRTSVSALALAALLAVASSVIAMPSARADVPRVATDIPPVHSLVARVMGELGRPLLVMRPGTSPHGYAMRPSEAAALEGSDVIFWIGEALTPWLEREIAVLAPDAVSVPLMALADTRRLGRRETAAFDAHDQHDADDAAHGDEHDTAYDPHGWLDPTNARRWLDAIAATLAAADPGNAARYAANATAGQADIDALTRRTAERLVPVRERRFVVFHDSFRYFEERFGVHAAGALSPSDASDPSPARVRDVREAIVRLGVGCVFAEPQFDPVRVRALVDGLPVATGTLDPLGAALEPGPALYGELVGDIADAMLECLST